jgi:hypothetical protein|tara:strand:- start:801 stop:1085 length:285 start_codon:yes stop_codon:yes gene_type:complete
MASFDLRGRPAELSGKPLTAWKEGQHLKQPGSTPFPLLDFSPEKAMRVLTDAKKTDQVESNPIEIGGTHDDRHSTPANPRSSLTSLAPAPTVSL